MSNEDNHIAYWEPRIMRHTETNPPEYAVHEVYFDAEGRVIAYTDQAISPRAASIEELKRQLFVLIQRTEDTFPLGDLQYIHHKDDILFWLEHIDKQPIDYTSTK